MRKQLSKAEIKEINKQLQEQYGLTEFFEKKEKIEIEENECGIIRRDGTACFFYYENKIIPILKTVLENNFLKKITVDTGAIKFVATGADIMRPGITAIDEGIKQGDTIAIIDEKHKKTIAIGITLYGTAQMKQQTQGKTVKNIHYAGDKLWKI